MHYEADWEDLEGNIKFERHLEKERLYEFLAGLNKDLDEVRGKNENLYLPLVKHLQKLDVRLVEDG